MLDEGYLGLLAPILGARRRDGGVERGAICRADEAKVGMRGRDVVEARGDGCGLIHSAAWVYALEPDSKCPE